MASVFEHLEWLLCSLCPKVMLINAFTQHVR